MAGRGNDLKAISSKPMSVEQIVQSAQSYDYNPLIPLRYWLRTANTLLKEVLTVFKSLEARLATDRRIGRDLRA